MLKLTFIADIHHYSKTLGTNGKAYEFRSNSDQKCLAQTGEIIDSAFTQIANSDTDAVMIAGDLTNDGEIASHNELKEKLYELKKKKRVYVITATHDWCCDKNPRFFIGNSVCHSVDVMSSQDLGRFYEDFGPAEAKAKFLTHIGTYSYVIELNKKVRLLALNDDKNGNDCAGFTNEHFDWIEKQIQCAKRDGCLMIGMEHHLLIPHIHPLITGGACVANREYVASRLADAGLKYMFVGHSHIQNTADYTTKLGNTLTEINIGSLCGYPAPIVQVTIDDDMKVSYRVEHLQKFYLSSIEIDAQQYLKNHARAIIHKVLDAKDKEEFAQRMTALITTPRLSGDKIAKYYFAIKPVLNHIANDTVDDLCSHLRLLGLSRYIDKNAANTYKDKKIVDFIDEILYSALDGSVTKYDPDSDYYNLVMSIVSIPSEIMKNNATAQKFREAVHNVLTGGKHNNQYETLV